MWDVLLCLVAFGRHLFQCFICVERYIAVEHPIVFLKYKPLRYQVAVLAFTWMSPLIICCVSCCPVWKSRGPNASASDIPIHHLATYFCHQVLLLCSVILRARMCPSLQGRQGGKEKDMVEEKERTEGQSQQTKSESSDKKESLHHSCSDPGLCGGLLPATNWCDFQLQCV